MEKYCNGEKITAADDKFIAAYLASQIQAIEKSGDTSQVRNPFTGESLDANPLEKSIVDFVQDLSYNEFHPTILAKYNVSRGSAIQTFDRARYLLLKINQSMYSAILD